MSYHSGAAIAAKPLFGIRKFPVHGLLTVGVGSPKSLALTEFEC